MSFEFDPIYLIYLTVAVSAGLFVEGVYLLFFAGASYRKNVNRRLKLLRNEPNRENILVQLRKERGLTGAGNYSVSFEALNRLVLQSGLTIGLKKLIAFIVGGAVAAFSLAMVFRGDFVQALLIGLFCGTVLPYLVLRIIASLAGSLGGVALLLAMVGLYGVLSHVVARRTREIGIRIAMGADRRRILSLVLRDGFRPVLSGLVIGLFVGVALRVILKATVVTSISPVDLVVFSLVPVPFVLAAVAACYVPAARAARVDPNVALRDL